MYWNLSMDRETLKKYILFLNKISEREVVFPNTHTPKENRDDPANWWDLDNYDHELPEKVFVSFLQNLEKLGILEIMHIGNVPDFKEDDSWDSYTDEVILDYVNVDTEKLQVYKSELTSLLTPAEKLDIRTKIETPSFGKIIKEGGGLKLHEGGAITYKNREVSMRVGLKELCEIFIDRPNQILDRNTLEYESGIHTRDLKNTVAKYICELNTRLEPHFNRKPIINHKKQGWIFKP